MISQLTDKAKAYITELDEIIPADINNTDLTLIENQPTTDKEGLRNRRNIKPPEKLDH